MNPRVTVIIPTFNWCEVLPYAIGSVLRQTFRDFELLVVGDGCTDDSERVATTTGDARVHWINLPQNTGHQSAPNNEGLRQARGEIIAYLGHDDLWLPRHLELHVRAYDETRSDLAYSVCLQVGPDESTGWPSIPRPSAGSFSPPACMTHLRRVTEEIGGWRDYATIDEARDVSPDVELWRRAQTSGRTFTFVPRLTGIKFPASLRRNVYRLRPSSEQARWLTRIDARPDLEAEILVDCLVSQTAPTGFTYRNLLRLVVRQTAARVHRRMIQPLFFLRGSHRGAFDKVRRFKGLYSRRKNP
jgi:glycosyltransferase involved in cell wall biosynthesis